MKIRQCLFTWFLWVWHRILSNVYFMLFMVVLLLFDGRNIKYSRSSSLNSQSLKVLLFLIPNWLPCWKVQWSTHCKLAVQNWCYRIISPLHLILLFDCCCIYVCASCAYDLCNMPRRLAQHATTRTFMISFVHHTYDIVTLLTSFKSSIPIKWR